MSAITWAMLALLAVTTIWLIVRRFGGVFVMYALDLRPKVVVRLQDGAIRTVVLDERPAAASIVDQVLTEVGMPAKAVPLIIVPDSAFDTPTGRLVLGLPSLPEKPDNDPRDRGLLEKLKPWIGPVVSFALFVMAAIIVFRPTFSADDKKWAQGTLMSVLAYWGARRGLRFFPVSRWCFAGLKQVGPSGSLRPLREANAPLRDVDMDDWRQRRPTAPTGRRAVLGGRRSSRDSLAIAALAGRGRQKSCLSSTWLHSRMRRARAAAWGRGRGRTLIRAG